MKYPVLFSLLAIGLSTVGLKLGGFGLLLLWPSASFLAVAAAYSGMGPKVFGKRSDGQISLWALIILLPYLLFFWGIWHLQRLFLKEDCHNQVAPGIWLGRRAFVNELPENINLIVDLTAEFPAHKEVIAGKTYICLPTLDAGVPDEQTFKELVKQIATWEGNIYLHCAIGHGRSATVAAALLVAKGLTADAKEAEAMLKLARPWVKLSKAQRNLLERVLGEAAREADLPPKESPSILNS